jgi:hypothetical protein
MKYDTKTIVMAALAVLLIAGGLCLIFKMKKGGCGCQDAETLTGVENSLGR